MSPLLLQFSYSAICDNSKSLMSRFARSVRLAIFRNTRKIASLTIFGCFLVLRKLLFVSFCVVVWVLFSVFSIFCITSLVSATPRNHPIFSVTRDFSQFFVMLINTKPDRAADLTKFAKIAKNRQSDDFSRYLQFLAVLCHVKAHFFSCSRSLKCSL